MDFETARLKGFSAYAQRLQRDGTTGVRTIVCLVKDGEHLLFLALDFDGRQVAEATFSYGGKRLIHIPGKEAK